MIDKTYSENDNLSEFADYLAEFDSTVSFDNETCPVCGVNISDSLSIEKSPYVEYKSINDESKLLLVTRELESKHIPFRIEKKLNIKITEQIDYVFVVFVPFKYLVEL